MKRALAALAAIALALSLAACEPETGDGRKPAQTKPRADAGQAKPPKDDGKGAQPAPVEGDPGAHNTEEGEVDLHLSWTHPNTARTPLCEWSKNGVSQPCANMHEAVKESGSKQYIGLWEHTTTGKSGDVFTLNAEGISGTDPECAIAFKGQLHGGTTHRYRCGVSYTIP